MRQTQREKDGVKPHVDIVIVVVRHSGSGEAPLFCLSLSLSRAEALEISYDGQQQNLTEVR